MELRRIAVLCLLAGLFLFPALSQSGEARTALLIANSEYQNYSKLPNPVPEAQALKKVLETIGFDVTLVTDASKDQMQNALLDFGDKLAVNKGVAFFHYGGHAVQVAGKNYLIPTTANIPNEDRAKVAALDVEEVTNILGTSGSKTNIIILDSCRNNPLTGSGRSASRGLSVVSNSPNNSIIVYSAQAGSVAQDGLFTPTLTAKLATPGASLQEILQDVRKEVSAKSNGAQIPGSYDQLFEPVFLRGMGGRPGNSSLAIKAWDAGKLYIDNVFFQDIAKDETIELKNIAEGFKTLEVRYDSEVEKKPVNIKAGDQTTVNFTYERNPVFFAKLKAVRPGTIVRWGDKELKPNAKGLYELPVGEQLVSLEHPLLKSKTFNLSATTRQEVALDWSQPDWRTGSFSVADVPADTVISLKGDNGFMYKWTQSANGPFESRQPAVIGHYAVSFAGPYLDTVTVSVDIREGQPNQAKPRLQEYGLLTVANTSAIGLKLRVLDADQGTEVLSKDLAAATSTDKLKLPQGNYRLLYQKPGDIAPAAVQDINLPIRLSSKATLADPGDSVALRYQKADQAYQLANTLLGPMQQTRDGYQLTGWILLGAGVASGGVATFAYFDGAKKYSDYLANPYTSDLATMNAQTTEASKFLAATLSGAITGLAGSAVAFLLAPDPTTAQADNDSKKNSLQLLKAQYDSQPDYFKTPEVGK